jgi:hypothetical protein
MAVSAQARNYKSESTSVQHIGAMAQDFRAAEPTDHRLGSVRWSAQSGRGGQPEGAKLAMIYRGALFMQRKIFWILMILLGMIAGFALPLIWAVIAQLPIIVLSWWIAYRSEWFD